MMIAMRKVGDKELYRVFASDDDYDEWLEMHHPLSPQTEFSFNKDRLDNFLEDLRLWDPSVDWTAQLLLPNSPIWNGDAHLERQSVPDITLYTQSNSGLSSEESDLKEGPAGLPLRKTSHKKHALSRIAEIA